MKSKFFLETIKIFNGKIYHLSYHQARYEAVLKSLGQLRYKKLQNYIKPPLKGLYRCRVVYDKETIDVSYHPYKPRKINSLKLVHDNTIEYTQKSLDRTQLDYLFKHRGVYDEVLIVKNNLLCDTTIANIAFYKDGVWYTPKTPLLHGVTRQRLLDQKKIVLRDIDVNTLESYTEIALLNAMVEFKMLRISETSKDFIKTI